MGSGDDVELPGVDRLVISRSATAGSVALVLIGLALGGLQLRHDMETRFPEGDLPICRVVTSERVVALTFDDGPDPAYTPAILDLLQQAGARATFFVIGRKVEEGRSALEQEARLDMEIGIHTWTHRALGQLTVDDVRREIHRTQRALASFSRARSFRAPFGVFLPSQALAFREAGLVPIHWSMAVDHIVGERGLGVEGATAALLSEVRPGDIILFHDAPLGRDDPGDPRRAALAVLAAALPRLADAGYRFVTVGDLIGMGEPVRAEPRPWFWQTGFTCPR